MNFNQKGQAVITILFFMVISISILTAVVIVVYNSASSGSSVEQGTVAYYGAEAGVENAILRILRDPSYTGESFNINGAVVDIQVQSGTITVSSQFEKSIRRIEVDTVYNNNVLEILSWKEIE